MDFANLPCLSTVFCVWLRFSDIAKVDTAVCSWEMRSKFAKVIKSCKFPMTKERTLSAKILSWMEAREVAVEVLKTSGEELQSYMKASSNMLQPCFEGFDSSHATLMISDLIYQLQIASLVLQNFCCSESADCKCLAKALSLLKNLYIVGKCKNIGPVVESLSKMRNGLEELKIHLPGRSGTFESVRNYLNCKYLQNLELIICQHFHVTNFVSDVLRACGAIRSVALEVRSVTLEDRTWRHFTESESLQCFQLKIQTEANTVPGEEVLALCRGCQKLQDLSVYSHSALQVNCLLDLLSECSHVQHFASEQCLFSLRYDTPRCGQFWLPYLHTGLKKGQGAVLYLNGLSDREVCSLCTAVKDIAALEMQDCDVTAATLQWMVAAHPGLQNLFVWQANAAEVTRFLEGFRQEVSDLKGDKQLSAFWRHVRSYAATVSLFFDIQLTAAAMSASSRLSLPLRLGFDSNVDALPDDPWLITGFAELRGMSLRGLPVAVPLATMLLCRFHRVQVLELGMCSTLDNDALKFLAAGCPHLTSFALTCCARIGDEGVCAVCHQCRALEIISINACNAVSDVTCRAIALHCAKVKTLRFYSLELVTMAGITVILENAAHLSSFYTENLPINHWKLTSCIESFGVKVFML